jgi:hypothetical protein
VAKWNIDKLCRPKKYMGQIMAECDCQSKLCEDRGCCMAETPSPEAIVKAALERAAEHHDRHAKGYARTCQQVDKAVHQEHARRIRSLASDPAEVAAIIKKAAEDRG